MSQWDHRADVVIVGAGGAGLSAAAAAADKGASVVMLEAAAEPGGTTKRSGGAFWIPNNTFLRNAGLTDPRDGALKLMARLAYPSLYDPEAPNLGLTELQHGLLAAFYDKGSFVIDELIRLGAIDPMILPQLGYSPSPVSDPDYHAELPENQSPYGRVLTTKSPPGSFEWPGVFLIGGMLAHAKGLGIPILTSHRVTRAITNEIGEIIGVEATHGGATKRVRAKKGVIFATGGFAHGAGRALSFLRGPIFGSGSVPTSDGAFIEIASRLGARLGNLASGFYYQVALVEAAAQAGAITRPDAHVFLPYGDSMIIVNKYGRRVVNEKAMYHERAQSHFEWSVNEYPNLVQIMIYDQPVADEPTFWPWRGVVPLPGQPSPFVIKADTLQSLAGAIDARLTALRGAPGLSAVVGPNEKLAPDFAATLKATITRFNAFAQTGIDLDFHRGETPIEPAWQGPSRGAPNRTMTAISPKGPYYAVLLGAGALDTCGGPMIGPNAQVLREDGAPIPGLYGAGNCIASPAGQAYWGAGGTIGPALVFGFLAGQNAAQSTEDPK
jgi:hypothetical protein